MPAAFLLGLLLQAASPPAAGIVLPAERRHVYDLAGWISDGVEKRLEERLAQIAAAKDGPRIVVLALQRPAKGDDWAEPLEARAVAGWGLDADRSRVCVLYVFADTFQHEIPYGKPISKEQDTRLEASYEIAWSVIARDGDRGLGIEAGALAIADILAGRPPTIPPPPPFVPGASGWVKDEASILAPSIVDRLNGVLAAHEKATSNQVVVLTVASLGGQVVEAVALRRATELKIGQKGKDNGILLLVAPNERKVRIEVGYGLEATLPDAKASRIVEDEILPYFRRQDMGGGIEAGVKAILGTIDGSYTPSPVARARHFLEPLQVLPRLGYDGQFLTGFFGGFVIFGLGYVLWSADEHWFRWVRASLAAIPALVIAVNYPIALLAFAVIAIALLNRNSSGGGSGYSYSSGGSSWGGSSSSWSSSSSSSSSSSFSGGGGSFGGGGASGSW